MGGYQLTAISEREHDQFIARCIEFDVTCRGASREAALLNLKAAVASFIATAKDSEILSCLERAVEVTLFEVEPAASPAPPK